ncbi:UDP-N-acetylmuramate dehydrogenase [candidate division WOR-3 bacterium]|nr:UDP-N-acetylmuramate dehydrogenase [candidate division WOR-3 bacterium]
MKELEIKGELREKEPLSRHTSLLVGGEARYFLYAEGVDDIMKSISFCEHDGIPYYIIGKGSNVLFLDEGFSGLVITTERLDRIEVNENIIRSQAGASLIEIIKRCKEASLSGLESLSGIPGTIGGAVIMNAGAYECEIGDLVLAVSILRKGDIIQLEDFRFGYRESTLKEEIILEVNLMVNEGDRSEIERRMEEVLEKRKINLPQLPKDTGTCGSVFKNPENKHAGFLIDRIGLKGRRVGGAMISMEHANYILTNKYAKSQDVVELIRRIRDAVEKKYGIILETEVVIVGKEKEIQI